MAELSSRTLMDHTDTRYLPSDYREQGLSLLENVPDDLMLVLQVSAAVALNTLLIRNREPSCAPVEETACRASSLSDP